MAMGESTGADRRASNSEEARSGLDTGVVCGRKRNVPRHMRDPSTQCGVALKWLQVTLER